jgi:ubiquinone/menaquinone biosynthesis C-methylase UbiE
LDSYFKLVLFDNISYSVYCFLGFNNKKQMKTKQIKKFYNRYHNEKGNVVDHFMQEKRCKMIKGLLENSSGKFLVIGCGSKDDMSVLPEAAEAVGVDISEEAVKISSKNYPKFKFLVSDASSLPFNDNSFDNIVCSEVIEHVEQREKAFLEMKRVLKDGGSLVITTPNYLSSWGLARKIAEKILKKPVTAADQPIDNWTTLEKLDKELRSFGFLPKARRGLWFYPPFGKGKIQIPYFLTFPLIFLFYPIEIFARRFLPWFGHMILIKAYCLKEMVD